MLTEDSLADLRAGLLGRRLDLIFVPAVAGADGCARRLIGTEAIHYLPQHHPQPARSSPTARLNSAISTENLWSWSAKPAD